jgi:ribonuclease Z
MAVMGESGVILIDCVGNPIVRLHQAGLDSSAITDIILTHFHPDHVGGIPLLLMDLWLLGRVRQLNLYGLEYTLDRVEKMMALSGWETWPGFFPVKSFRLPEKEMAPVLQNPEMRIFASPVCHLIPNIGVRIEFIKSGKTFAYSCDTEPCREVVRLAQGVDVLVHEATGESHGYSSAEQAGEIAREAGAKSLYLAHYPTGEFVDSTLAARAAESFGAPVYLATDFLELEF